jgi:hypothetical protein
MTTRLPPVCVGCVHYREIDMPLVEDYAAVARSKTGRCDAYPGTQALAIPFAIWHNTVVHRQPYDGDHGIQFKAVDKNAEQYADLIASLDEEPDGRPE